jgi:hypothetical protein
MTTIDFARTHKALYTATLKVKEVQVESATYLGVDGDGPPGGNCFQAAIQALYGATYTIKYALKFGGREDFKVGKLECLYLVDDPERTPKEKWKWRLMLRVPDGVTGEDLARARRALKEKKGLDASRVRRVSWKEGAAVQTLHVGPYERLGESYARLDESARADGLVPVGPGHEIYLSDPRRVAPERLKTIIRIPLKKG